MGRPALNKLRATTSTYYLKVKFPKAYGVGEIREDQVLARKCYQAALASRENHTWVINEPEPIPEPSETPQEVEVVPGDSSKVLKIGSTFPTLEKEKMISLLRANQDVFAWKHKDMPGIDRKIIQHRLNINLKYKLVQQKWRIFALERNKAVTEKVEKLLEAGFIREVFYPDWLVNVVMVKKSNGKWRMYVDFTDLNKACLRDSFPLPRIDQLVDLTTRYKLLSFMDAFSRYNQILTNEEDQEKISFVTSQGLYCYKVMPFGLKNAGAIYQRLVNRMFSHQIGRNVEVHINDMLVKSKDEANYLDDLKETFSTLYKYNMKLNPAMCVFAIALGKFLGLMVSQRGIEANLDKVKEIIEVKSPKIVKEV